MKDYLKTAYCEDCDEEVYFKETKMKIVRHMGSSKIPVEVEVYRGICPKCGRILAPSKYNLINDKIIFDEYKKKMGLLTSEDIIRIRKKRHMSQVALAKFIHCGEKNIARYERAGIQDPVFDYLIRLVDNDEVYEQMKVLNREIAKNKSVLSLKNV